MGTGLKGLKKTATGWVIDKIVHGRRLHESLGNISQNDAELLFSKKVADLLEGHRPLVSKRSLTVSDILSTFWENKLKKMDCAKNTWPLLSMVDDELGVVRLENLSILDCLKYAQKIMGKKSKYKKPYSYRTMESGLEKLNSAIEFAMMNRMIQFNPILHWKKEIKPLYAPKQDEETILLDDGAEGGDDWKALYNALPDKYKPIFGLLYETGMRKREVLELRWLWVDIAGAVIRLPGFFDNQRVQKSGKPRKIPLTRDAIQILLSQDKSCEFVFHNNGRPIVNIDKAYQEARAAAGIDQRFKIHSLRKQRATIWNRIDEYAAMRALGHSDSRTHRNRYAVVTEERMKGLVGNETGTVMFQRKEVING